MNCYVCFDENVKCISCCNKYCDNKICYECFNRYIDINDTKTLLVCECKSIYMYQSVNDLNTQNKYSNFLISYIRQNNELNADIEDILNFKLTLDKIKNEKIKYIEENLPICVSTMLNWCYQDKINDVNKKIKSHLSKKFKFSRRKCFNIECRIGLLITDENNDYICNCCDKKYCVKCEEEIKPNHICKQENIDSLSFIDKIRKCPSCHLTIYKNEGCNNMTCKGCGTHFYYDTGYMGGLGNHDSKIDDSYISGIKNLSERINEYSENIVSLVKRIENRIPVILDKKKIVKDIMNGMKNENNTCSIFCNYKKSIIEMREYNKILLTLDKLHEEKKLTYENVSDIYNNM